MSIECSIIYIGSPLELSNVHPSILLSYDFMQGSSLGQFFKQYLEPIKLNDVLVITNLTSVSFHLV